MNNDIKTFIEKNIGLIEYEDWGNLFEQSYEWLSDEQCKELINILSSTLDVDLKPFAIDFLKTQIMTELQNLAADYKAHRIGSTIYIHSFIRKYFNHVQGQPLDEFIALVEEQVKQSKKFKFLDVIDGPYIEVKK